MGADSNHHIKSEGMNERERLRERVADVEKGLEADIGSRTQLRIGIG